jgi:hypothetical protein
MNAEGVAAALTSPYIDTPTAIPIDRTVAAMKQAAAEISAELGAAHEG